MDLPIHLATGGVSRRVRFFMLNILRLILKIPLNTGQKWALHAFCWVYFPICY